MNNIRYKDKQGTEFDANVTNDVGVASMEVLAAILAIRGGSKPLPIRFPKSLDKPTSQAELFTDVSEETPDPAKALPPAPQTSPIPPTSPTTPAPLTANSSGFELSELFEESDGVWSILDPELKGADSQTEYTKRLVAVFVHFRHEQGVSAVSRKEVNALLKDCNLDRSSFRRWLAGSDGKSILIATEKELKLNRPGKDFAKLVLQEMQDENVPAGFKLGKPKKKYKKGPRKPGDEGEAGAENEG